MTSLGTHEATTTSGRGRQGGEAWLQRRREILEVAATIFFEKGYEATSTKDIAEAVGILKGSLYHYVESKEDFLFELIRETHEGALLVLDSVRRIEGSALVKLAALIEGQLTYHAQHIKKTTIFFREFRLLSDERKALIIVEGDAYLDFVRELLRQGQQEGTVSPELDVSLSSIGIISIVNSMWQWYGAAGRLSPHEISRRFSVLIVGGVSAR